MSKSYKKMPCWMFGTLFFLILLGLVFGIYNVRESFTEGSCSSLEKANQNAKKASDNAFKQFKRKNIQVQRMKQRIDRANHQFRPHVTQLHKLRKILQKKQANHNNIKKKLDECRINTTHVQTQNTTPPQTTTPEPTLSAEQIASLPPRIRKCVQNADPKDQGVTRLDWCRRNA
ncbi:MAG: hypothetical protein Ct9H90mP28_6600 [Paracoccaceae bacterium]|nr:MAG: hypothetical protein Ct9H90mP28_6600 [Paracoccaceae bacterium]